MQERFKVKVSVSRRTNHDRVQLIDLARRQVDYLGLFKAKLDQKDVTFCSKGKIELSFDTRESARAFQSRVERLGFSELETQRFRIKKSS